MRDRLIIFEEVCHSCGGCVLLCPEKALTEKERVIGKIQKGISGGVNVNTGLLNIGEALGIPIINELINNNSFSDQLTLIDCPPGGACIVMDSIKDADYCILVAEPTLFGVHNLNMVHELVKLFNKPCGVVLNKCIEGVNTAEQFCIKNNIKILGRIPFDNELGKLNSNAKIAVKESNEYKELFSTLLESVKKEVRNETTANS